MFERNSKLLSESHMELWKKLNMPPTMEFPDVGIGFGQGENSIDGIVYKLGETLLLDKDNEGIDNWVNLVNPINHTIIVLGLGMGCQVNRIIQKYPDKKVIVIEPDKRVLIHAMHLWDMEDIIRKVEFWVEEDILLVKAKIFEMLTHPLARGIQVIPYIMLHQPYCSELMGHLQKMLNDWAVMVNTKRCLVDKWYENRIRNDQTVSVNFSNFVDKFKGIPAILVGGGASLIEHIPILKQLENKAIIFAAGTTIEILLHHGVTPTFMAAIDQDPISEGGLHENLDVDVPLIFDGQVAYNSLYYKGKRIQMRLNVNKYTGLVIPDLPIIESAPSIGNVSLDILHKMGCSPIIMVGMDFSYGYEKLYCDGTRFQEERKKTGQSLAIVNNFGETAETEPSFLSMVNWFEEYVPRVKPDVTNCTYKGIVFKNIPWKPITDFVFDKEYDFKSMINECYQGYIDLLQVKQAREKIVNELEQIKKCIDENNPPAAQQVESWVLVDEFAQSLIYLEEIRCEDRIKRGTPKADAVKEFQNKRREIILESIDKLVTLFKK